MKPFLTVLVLLFIVNPVSNIADSDLCEAELDHISECYAILLKKQVESFDDTFAGYLEFKICAGSPVCSTSKGAMELTDVCVKLCWAFEKAFPCYLPERIDEAESVCEIKENVYPEENCIWDYMQQFPECTADHKEVFILIQQLLIKIYDLKETGAAIHREIREVPDFEASAVSPLTVVLVVGTMDF